MRVIANYADIIVIRHPRDGAARLAAEYSPIPVINGGDGSHEHPTQTLCDLFTLKQKNKRLKNLKVAISGDLKGSRTIHSFVYALARFGATIMPMPAKGMELPAHVDQRLREEFRCHMVPVPKGDGDDASIDALYVTPEEPHQQSLFSGPEIERDAGRDLEMVDKKVDALYVTRFQKERWVEKDQAYPRIDRKFLNEPKYSDASVMHPLPRVGELDVAFDTDRRAVYFEQAAYGVPIRMALISLLLGLKGKSLHRFEGGFERDEYPVYDQPRSLGLHCANPNCIVHDPMEAQYVRNKFYRRAVRRLRRGCAASIASARSSTSSSPARRTSGTRPTSRRCARSTDHGLKDVILFADEADAQAAGFHSRRAAAEPRPARRAGGRSRCSASGADAMLDAIDWSLLAVLRRRLPVRLSLRLDPVRRHPDAARRHAGHPHRRLRQYRRHQCAAHRPQGAGGGDAARRHAQGHGRRAGGALCSSAATWRWSPGSAHSSATSFRSGCASRAARASRPISASCSASPGRRRSPSASIWLAVAALTRYSSLSALIASAATPAMLLAPSSRPRAGAVRAADGHAVDHASRQYRAAAAGHRRQDRAEELPELNRFSRRLRIVGAHHVVLHRNADVERHQRQQAERQIGVEHEQRHRHSRRAQARSPAA